MLRHARAGTKVADPELDFVRGLDPIGKVAANVVAGLILEHVRPTLLVSSPFARCIETLRPVSEAIGLPVRARAGLTPTSPSIAFKRLLLSAPDGAVLCTHGEVIMRAFAGLDCEKGAFWVVHRENGKLHPAIYASPALPTRVEGRLAVGEVGTSPRRRHEGIRVFPHVARGTTPMRSNRDQMTLARHPERATSNQGGSREYE